jgi:succinyl-diaminopimelate desuccinylase
MVPDKDELVRVTQDLIRFKTTKDNLGEMRRCITYIKNYYKGIPVIIEEHVSNGKPSLFITLRKTKKPAFLMNGHIDVIEADEEQFSPFVRDGKLFGRGAVDMKAGVAACMLALKKAAQSKKKQDIGLMIVSDEEVSGEDGTGYLVLWWGLCPCCRAEPM